MTDRLPVSVSDVIRYAKKSCKTCFGKGVYQVNRQHRITVDTCGCAIRRFFKKNPQVEQDPGSHAWFWPASMITPIDETTPSLETK